MLLSASWAPAAAPPAAALVPAKLRRVALLGDPSFRHAETITHVLPLPDGKRVLTTARDASARLWDLASGAELRRYYHPRGEDVWSAVLLPGAREFLTSGEGKCALRWSLDAAKPLHTYEQEGIVFRLAVDKQGTRLATADYKNRSVLLDVKTGKEVRRFTGHKKSVYTVLFSRDGKKLITGSGDETIRFWDVATGKELRQVKNATGDIYTLIADPQQRRILVCCENKSIWLMDAESGKEIWQANLPQRVYSGAWSGDGKLVAASCQDRRLYLLDAATGKKRWSAALPAGTNYATAFSSDSRQVLCSSRCVLCRFDAKTGARLFPKPDSPAQNSPVVLAAPVPKIGAVLRVDENPGISVLDRKSGALRQVWLPKEDVNVVAVSPDSSKVLGGGDKTNAWLLDAATGKLLHRLGHADISGVGFSPDGELAVTAGRADSNKPGLVVWRVADGKALSKLAGRGRTNAVSVGPEGRRVAAICGKEVLRVWSLQTGRLLREISLKGKSPSACAFVPSGEHSLLVRDKSGLALWTSPRVRGAPLTDAEIRLLIAQLGADKYRTREKATGRLIQGGDSVLAALAKVRTKDAEVQIRLRHIQETVLNSGNAYELKGQVPFQAGTSTSLSLHPDGRHWAALEGTYFQTRIVIGRIDIEKLTVVRRIEGAFVPWLVRFGRDGRLYVGNRNGTISIYASGG